MKKFLFCGLLALSCTFLSAQKGMINPADSLIGIGVQLHNAGLYEQAIEKYNEALEINRSSQQAFYQIAYAYAAMHDYDNALKYCDKVIKGKSAYAVQAYDLKGSILDHKGETKKAIQTYEKGMKLDPGYYLIYYNLGITYNNTGEREKAVENFIKAAEIRPTHASSHYALGTIMANSGKWTERKYSMYYFLLVEPHTKRSENAMKMLNPPKNRDGNEKITITLNPSGDKVSRIAELMQGISEAGIMANQTDSLGNKKTNEELFIDSTKKFFNLNGPFALQKEPATYYWKKFYVPFFQRIGSSEYIDVFCYYIMSYNNDTATQWLKDNEKRVDDFFEWLNKPK